MTLGTEYYLYYFKVPGVRPFPLGVFDHPPDEDLIGVKSVRVGRSRVVSWFHEYTEALDEFDDFISTLPTEIIP